MPYHTKDAEGRCCWLKVGDCLSVVREADISRPEGVFSRTFASDECSNVGLIVVAVAVEQGKTFGMVNPEKIIWSAITFIVVFSTKRISIRFRLAGKCDLIMQILIMSI